MNRDHLSIALMTPINNPSKQQINNLVATYESLNDVIDCFYVGISSRSTNIELLKETRALIVKLMLKMMMDPDDAIEINENY